MKQPSEYVQNRVIEDFPRQAIKAGRLIMGINVPISKESNRTNSTRSGSTEPGNAAFGDKFKFLKSAKPFDVGKNYLQQRAAKPQIGPNMYVKGPSPYETPPRRFSSLNARSKPKVNLPEVANYLSIDEMVPLTDPESEWLKCVKDIKCSLNSSIQFDCCNITRRLCFNHAKVIADSPLLLHGFILDLLKLVESLRTSLAKNALLLLGDLYTYVTEIMENTLNFVIPLLLRKDTESGSFLGPHVVSVLKKICENCTETKVISIFIGSVDEIMKMTTQVKLRVIHCLNTLIRKLNKKISITKEGEKIICILSELLSEPSLEVRNAPLHRELDHNDISGTIEDTNGAFAGLDNLRKL